MLSWGSTGRLPSEGQRYAPRLGTDAVSQSPCPCALPPTSGSTLNTRLELFVTGFARLSPNSSRRACISLEHLTQLSGALSGREHTAGLGRGRRGRGVRNGPGPLLPRSRRGSSNAEKLPVPHSPGVFPGRFAPERLCLLQRAGFSSVWIRPDSQLCSLLWDFGQGTKSCRASVFPPVTWRC